MVSYLGASTYPAGTKFDQYGNPIMPAGVTEFRAAAAAGNTQSTGFDWGKAANDLLSWFVSPSVDTASDEEKAAMQVQLSYAQQMARQQQRNTLIVAGVGVAAIVGVLLLRR